MLNVAVLFSVWSSRRCVPAVDQAILKKDEEFREIMAEEEVRNFLQHRKKKPVHGEVCIVCHLLFDIPTIYSNRPGKKFVKFKGNQSG